ncbi:DUF3116 family protein [Listeria valentina]|uniref:DUF3116 family protein n=1 Tax=Listeria valentina TaxID=2705293 RepID=UPI00142F946D|nr:DUF3116 family protein [Listeria valentina]
MKVPNADSIFVILRATYKQPQTQITQLTLRQLNAKRVHYHSKTELLHTVYWLEWKDYLRRKQVDSQEIYYELTEKGREMYQLLQESNVAED